MGVESLRQHPFPLQLRLRDHNGPQAGLQLGHIHGRFDAPGQAGKPGE